MISNDDFFDRPFLRNWPETQTKKNILRFLLCWFCFFTKRKKKEKPIHSFVSKYYSSLMLTFIIGFIIDELRSFAVSIVRRCYGTMTKDAILCIYIISKYFPLISVGWSYSLDSYYWNTCKILSLNTFDTIISVWDNLRIKFFPTIFYI